MKKVITTILIVILFASQYLQAAQKRNLESYFQASEAFSQRLEQISLTNGSNITACNIKLLDEDRENYNQVMQGFVQGMYRTPPNPCTLCNKLGQIAGTLQVNFITLEKNRDKWINIQDIFKLDFFTQINRLITITVLFATTAVSLDQILRDPMIMGMIDLVIKRFDPSYLQSMQMNVLDNLSQLAILWTLAPGASCHGLGVRAGTTLKRLMKITFETIDESKYVNQTINGTNSTNQTLLAGQSNDYMLY